MNTMLAKPALSGAIGTTFMTLFSSLVSDKKNRQFREQEILSELLKVLPLDKRNRLALAWILHYMMGTAFNVVNQNLLKRLKTSPTFLNGLLLGAINGTIGIAIWKLIFEVHPSPPNISFKRFLAHLMLAHLVFAALSNISMRGMRAKPNQQLSPA